MYWQRVSNMLHCAKYHRSIAEAMAEIEYPEPELA
jgi:hypothetical protein